MSRYAGGEGTGGSVVASARGASGAVRRPGDGPRVPSWAGPGVSSESAEWLGDVPGPGDVPRSGSAGPWRPGDRPRVRSCAGSRVSSERAGRPAEVPGPGDVPRSGSAGPWRPRGDSASAAVAPEMPSGLLDGVRQWLVESGAEPTPARVAQALREQGRVLGDAEVLGAAEQLRSELIGSGPLEPLLADPAVTDVLVSAPDRVWVDRGGGLELTSVSFPDAAAVRRLAQRLAAAAGRRLDDARPWADARLPDGTRLHAVLPPVAVGCTCLSLRVVRPRAFTLDELVAAGTVPPGGDRVLRALLEARLSFLVSGGTGSGKTTLLSALLGLVGRGERIVLAEDSAELRPDHPHVVRLETRPANQEGAGLVTLQDLVRQALRMRPDRLVVGEVRGPEVVHLLAALNTGHEGGCLV